MENVWKWVQGIAAALTIIAFFENHKVWGIDMFWEKLTFMEFVFYLSAAIWIISTFVNFFLSRSTRRQRLIGNKSRNGKIDTIEKTAMSIGGAFEIIKRPEGHHYFVQEAACRHIPDPETYEYLGNLIGFSWFDAKPMLFDEIKSKYDIGDPLPSVRSYFPKQDAYR